MKQLLLSVSFTLFSFLFCTEAVGQRINIQPTPQLVINKNETIRLPQAINYTGLESCSPELTKSIQHTLGAGDKKGKFKLIIGKRGDKTIKKYAKRIPEQAEGYYLLTDKNRIVIAGSDDRGVFYGWQTFLQIIDKDVLPLLEITDFPDVRYRGVVEGFYGTPWSYNDRVRQLEFYGRNKLNTYIYGPKDDPYHSSPNWRKPYPEKEAENIQKLVETSHAHQVDFVWAIHPGLDIRWNDEDRQHLIQKFEKMYELGVRSFAVFFDDISGEGTNPEKQAELLNYIDNEFIQRKNDVTPLVMCPTEYNKSWSNVEKGYLPTLGDRLNPSIHIMWTGDRVIAEITHEGQEWINPLIKRPAYVWWNFPVSDYVRDHLLMGPVYGNDTHIKDDLSGFVANPMERAEASKIAIYSVADYAWNMEKFDSQRSWNNAIKDLMPTSHKALKVFASHNSDLGPNGHGFRRKESVEMKPIADRIMNNLKTGDVSSSDLQLLKQTYQDILTSANLLLGSSDNPTLIKEIEPWLYQFKNLGERGLAVLRLIEAFDNDDRKTIEEMYPYIQALQVINYTIDHRYNQNPYQPGVKTGSLVMQPLADALFEYYINQINVKYETAWNAKNSYNPHSLESNMPQIKDIPLQTKRNQVIIAPVLEIVHWKTNQYIQLRLDQLYALQALQINLGDNEISQHIEIQLSTDGTEWKTISDNKYEQKSKVNLSGEQAQLIRIVNTKGDLETPFKGLILSLVLEE